MIATRSPRELYRYARTAAALPGPDALTNAEVAGYHQNGFVAVADVLSPDEVLTAKAAVADL